MSTKTRIFIAVLLLVVIIGIAAWFFHGVLSRGKIRNVLLISIDTCRADHLGCYGFGRKTTPHIDTIAQEGIVFKNAFSPIPLTLPAHGSMLTGTYPPYHEVHDNLNYRLGESNVTLAEILREQGYTTGAIVSTFILDAQFGVGQGFDSYNNRFEQPVGPHVDKERRGEEASRFACSYLEQHKNEPFFLFLHYFDPHTDYEPPEPFATTYADDLYTGEIAYTDHCIAQVIEKLKSLELYDSTLIIIVGDHGEMLGEHGESEHGYYIYQSATRVPFIIRPPGWRKSKKIDDVVNLVDVVPTILGYLEIPVPAYVQGKDLSVYSRRKPPSDPERRIYIESLTATKYGCNPLLGVVTERWKYIETTRPELYDLYQKPLEANNLVEKEAKRARFMRGQLQEMIAQLTGAGSADGKLALDEESRRRLESLGYVGGESVDDTFTFDQAKTDPKDLIQYYEYAQRVTYLIYYEKYDKAFAICDKMLTGWPEIPNTHFMLARIASVAGKPTETIEHGTKYLAMIAGTVNLDLEALSFSPIKPLIMTHQLIAKAYYKLGMFDKAGKHWTEILRMKSDWPNAHDELAAVYFQQGKFDQAAKHWTTALQLKPGWPEVHNNIAAVYNEQGKIDKAISHLREALRLVPDYPDAQENLDKLLYKKKYDELIAKHKQALKENPNDVNGYDELAKIYYQYAKFAAAAEHWNKALQLDPERPNICNNLAWVLATIEDEKLRNPAEAVRLAERACELTDYKQSGMLDTLAVAYAAVGRFADAVKTAEKAIVLARDAKQEKLAEDIRSRLELYKMNKPYRD